MHELVKKAKWYAEECHHNTGHKYNGYPYSVHLEQVYNYALKYLNLIDNKDYFNAILAACWTHDVIEDCRQTYNNVNAACGSDVAEITYALTNEKGKNRAERASLKYYDGIKNTPYALFVKICDRLANVNYSVVNRSAMANSYRKEYSNFKQMLYMEKYKPMFDELEYLLVLKQPITA